MNIDYKHTVQVNRRAWFIRFYCWLWEAEVFEINVCKLFWGYVFLPLGLLLHLIVFPIFKAVSKLGERHRAARRARIRAEVAAAASRPATSPRPAEPNRMQAVLTAISNFFTGLAMRIGGIVFRIKQHRQVARAFGLTLLTLALMVGIAAFGVLIYFAAKYIDTTIIVLIVLGSVIAAVLLLAALYAVGLFEALWAKLVSPAGKGAGKGAAGFFRVMGMGYVAVKSSTCPRIEVVEEDA